MSSRQPSPFVSVSELLGGAPADSHGRMLRTIGRLDHYSVKDSQVAITDWCSSLELVLDCRLVEPFPFKKGSLFQFIGEIVAGGGGGGESGERSEVLGGGLKGGGGGGESVILRVYSYRCVDGLDMDIYIKALETCHRR